MGPDGNPRNITGWVLLLTILISQHIFLLARWFVRYTLSNVDSPGLQKQRKERFAIRRQYLDEALGYAEAERFVGGGFTTGEKLDRGTLEGEHCTSREDIEGSDSPMLQKRNGDLRMEANYFVEEARQESLRDHGSQGERFWRRQQGKAETIEVGRRLIAKAAPTIVKPRPSPTARRSSSSSRYEKEEL